MKTQKPDDKVDEAESNLNSTTKRKTAFFITPLGSDDSSIRRATNGIIKAVLKPVLKSLDIDLTVPHEIDDPGNITKQVIRHILSADLVIADLTGLNANVMYELAVRHAKRLPVIIIAHYETKLPFDVAAERTVLYHSDMEGVVDLSDRLTKIIPIALNDKNPENPIYTGVESLLIREEIERQNEPILKYILEKMENLSDSVRGIRNNYAHQPNQERTELYYRYNVEISEPSQLKIDRLINLLRMTFAGLRNFLQKSDGISFIADELINFHSLELMLNDINVVIIKASHRVYIPNLSV